MILYSIGSDMHNCTGMSTVFCFVATSEVEDGILCTNLLPFPIFSNVETLAKLVALSTTTGGQ